MKREDLKNVNGKASKPRLQRRLAARLSEVYINPDFACQLTDVELIIAAIIAKDFKNNGICTKTIKEITKEAEASDRIASISIKSMIIGGFIDEKIYNDKHKSYIITSNDWLTWLYSEEHENRLSMENEWTAE